MNDDLPNEDLDGIPPVTSSDDLIGFSELQTHRQHRIENLITDATDPDIDQQEFLNPDAEERLIDT